MDAKRFDEFVRSVAGRRTRRSTLRAVAGGLALYGLRTAPSIRAQTTCTPSKEACQTTEECCRGACVANVCDSTCSEVDAICETTLDCCSSLSCVVVDGTPRCRPQSCAAQGDSCRSDGDCCEGSCLASVCTTNQPTQAATEVPTEAPTGTANATPIQEPGQGGGNTSGGGESGSNASGNDSGASSGVTTASGETSLPDTGAAPGRRDSGMLASAGALVASAGAVAAAFLLRRRPPAERD